MPSSSIPLRELGIEKERQERNVGEVTAQLASDASCRFQEHLHYERLAPRRKRRSETGPAISCILCTSAPCLLRLCKARKRHTVQTPSWKHFTVPAAALLYMHSRTLSPPRVHASGCMAASGGISRSAEFAPRSFLQYGCCFGQERRTHGPLQHVTVPAGGLNGVALSGSTRAIYDGCVAYDAKLTCGSTLLRHGHW